METKELENYRKSGKIASQVREWSRSLIKEGAKFIDIAEAIDKKIEELGGEEAFPVNLSVNNLAAHYTPGMKDENTLKKGDLLKVDIGVHIKGCIADTAYTIEVGNGNIHKTIIEASEDALKNAIATIKAGVTVSQVGAAIEKAITHHGFRPIANLSGHEVAEFELHAGLTIPNFENGSTVKLEEGMIIAVEPFATNGLGNVVDARESEIFQLTEAKAVRLPIARRIIETVSDEKQGLPFCRRWLAKRVGALGLETGLRELLMKGALQQYPVLKEQGDGLVSQAEHTMLVTKNGVEVLTL